MGQRKSSNKTTEELHLQIHFQLSADRSRQPTTCNQNRPKLRHLQLLCTEQGRGLAAHSQRPLRRTLRQQLPQREVVQLQLARRSLSVLSRLLSFRRHKVRQGQRPTSRLRILRLKLHSENSSRDPHQKRAREHSALCLPVLRLHNRQQELAGEACEDGSSQRAAFQLQNMRGQFWAEGSSGRSRQRGPCSGEQELFCSASVNSGK